MDLKRAILEILLRNLRFQRVSIHTAQGKNDYKGAEKSVFLQVARWHLPDYTEDENEQLYEWARGQLNTPAGIYDLIADVAGAFLEIRADGFYYLDQNWTENAQFFHWKALVTGLGQELFMMALLAKEHVKGNSVITAERLSDLLCVPFPQIGDRDLRRLLRPENSEDGPTENHFHLKGSFPVFLLNWTCLMNHIGDGNDFFHRMKEYREAERLAEQAETNRHVWFTDAMTAACYRLHLFEIYSGIPEDGRMPFSCDADPDETDLRMLQSRIEYYQDNLEPKWNGKPEQDETQWEWVYGLDYALAGQWDACYDRDEVSVAGERYFLYRCFCEIFRTDGCFGTEERNLFYRYLLISRRIRAELVQTNRLRGFGNFAAYQDRKEDVIDHYPAYQEQVIRLTGCSLRKRQKLSGMEMRITPKDTAFETLNRVEKYERELEQNAPEKPYGKYFFVLHFPKEREQEHNAFYARNVALRKTMERHLAEQKQLIRSEQNRNLYENHSPRVRGYDTCSGEIGCRPEVFACFYRSIQAFARELQASWIHLTYHVGEDFLDLTDGLRAIDEAVRFCDLPAGSRLGHGMALGLDAAQYYQIKQYKSLLPAQDLLDNLGWVLGFCQERGIVIEPELQKRLEARFCGLHKKLYGTILTEEKTEKGKGVTPESTQASEDPGHVRMSENQENTQGAENPEGPDEKNQEENPAEREAALTMVGGHDSVRAGLYTGLMQADGEPVTTGMKDDGTDAADWSLYYRAWKLRGDKPELYLADEAPVYGPDLDEALQKQKELEDIRADAKCREYYRRYHFSSHVREEGEKPELFEADHAYIALIGRIQEELRYILTEKRIGIECNPTSNYKIGPFDRFDQHPMLRMYGKNLEEGAASRMCISINTDDMGVFQTSLETEYAAMYVALRKCKDERGQYRYPKAAVLRWLEDVKTFGDMQMFRVEGSKLGKNSVHETQLKNCGM